MDIFLIGIISYLMGSIPFGYILTKIFLKKDIREIGSGNIGATNALRTGNKSIGYFTLALDILKAIIPVIYVKIFYQDFLYIASLCAFLGHVFPIWLKFKGGKGIATSLGVILSIDIFIGLCLLTIWILVFLIFFSNCSFDDKSGIWRSEGKISKKCLKISLIFMILFHIKKK